MITTLLKSIADHVATHLPNIKQVALYNEQWNYTEEELPVIPPAIYVEFGEIEWDDLGQKNQVGRLTINLHLVTEHLMPEIDTHNSSLLNQYDVAIMQNLHQLFLAFHGWQPQDSEGNPLGQTWVRRRTYRQPRPNSLHVWVTSFETLVYDNTAQPATQSVEATTQITRQ